MQRDEVIRILRENRDELNRQFGVETIRLFGSVARDEAGTDSDVDVLVGFSSPPSLFGFLRLKAHLQDLLGVSVDLVTEAGLRDTVRPYVEADAVNVA